MTTSKQADLKKLQAEWEERLRAEGFGCEIEGAGLKAVEFGPNIGANKSHVEGKFIRVPMQRKHYRDYYLEMSHRVEDPTTSYRNEIDKHILRRHVDGARMHTIVEELKVRGTPKERKTVRIIIRRYEQAWNVRHYTRAQLNRK